LRNLLIKYRLWKLKREIKRLRLVVIKAKRGDKNGVLGTPHPLKALRLVRRK
jgi:hypothetical protein